MFTCVLVLKRVTVIRDSSSKEAYAASAQFASEAVSAIRTVSALGRQNDCLDIYGANLRIPLRRSARSGIWIHALYGASQAMSFFAIALVFWYGSQLVADQKYSTLQFYVGLMVWCPDNALFNHKLLRIYRVLRMEPFKLVTSLTEYQTYLPPRALVPI